MIISDTSIKNRMSVIVLSIIIIVMGVYSYSVLPRESTPDISIPYVFVSTGYRGVSAEDIETSITIKIEKKLQGIDGVKTIESVSSEGQSFINVEFNTGVDIDDALQKVKDKVDEAKNDLPSDLENDPSVFEVNFSEFPIVTYSLASDCGDTCLKDMADDLEDEIEAIPGVLEVDVTGAREREIQVVVDPDKLAYYKIPITAFQSIIAGENQNTSGGSIGLGDGRYQLRVPGEFQDPAEIYQLVVSTFKGQPVYLKDVAEIRDTFKDETSRSRLDGQKAVGISVKKRTGENIIEIAEKVDNIIEKHQKAWPKGTSITKVSDAAKEIRIMVDDLENNILSGLLLVLIVLFFSLGMRNAILVSMAIPFSMLLTFIILQAMGITLNMVVLFSLTLALGMLVDNAIVIIENIHRFMEQGVGRMQAAMKATSEVAWPVIGSTLTTVAAFLPMIWWPGIMGGFMKYLPITLIITLMSSLFVALVINPTLASIFMKHKKRGPDKTDADTEHEGEKPIEIKGWVLKGYSKLLTYALKHRFLLLIMCVLSLVVMIQIWMIRVGLERPLEFMPSIDPNVAYINIDVPEGTDLDYNDTIAKTLEMLVAGVGYPEEGTISPTPEAYSAAYALKPHKTASGEEYQGPSDLANIQHVYATTARSAGAGDMFSSTSSNALTLQFIDLADRVTSTPETMEAVRRRIDSIPGAKITVAEEESGPPTGSAINIEISGDKFSVLGQLAEQTEKLVRRIPFVTDVQNDFQEAIPAIQVHVDRQKAALFGLTTDAVGFALKTAYNGLDVSTYYEDDEDYDITVTLAEHDRKKMDVLYQLMIPSPSGQLVPLTTIAQIEYAGIIGSITRIDQRRVVTVKANVDETKIPGAVARMQAQKMMEKVSLPSGYQVDFTGEYEFQQESQAFLGKAFVIALFLIFLVLVAQFNSVSQPLIILTSVVLSLGGVFLGLTAINSPFGVVMTGVGVISLAGVVVNNAIVLIDYTNKLVERGWTVREAIVAAGATRLRPVFLTAVTTILGLIPMLIGMSIDFKNMTISMASESTQWWQSMAAVVSFGLIIATFLTLVVVPVIYSMNEGGRAKASSFIRWIRQLYWKPFEARNQP